MHAAAVAHTLRAMVKLDPIIFTAPEEIHPTSTLQSLQRDATTIQGQAWFYVTDQQGKRHRIIVEEV